MIDSSGTFIAAYVLVAVIFVGYSLSLWSRARTALRALAPHHERSEGPAVRSREPSTLRSPE